MNIVSFIRECQYCGGRGHFASYHAACDVCGIHDCSLTHHSILRRIEIAILKGVCFWKKR